MIERIELKGLINTRDLGGLPTRDGRAVAPHRLIRSGKLYDMTDADSKLLTDEYGLRRVIDFRTDAERAQHPDPVPAGVKYVSLPILDEAALGITHESSGKELIKALAPRMTEGGDYMEAMYRGIIGSAHSRAQYRRFFEMLLDNEEGATLWHCSAGKDRVGVGTALLLTALGVSREKVTEDFLATNRFTEPTVDAAMAQLGLTCDAEREAMRIMFLVKPSYMDAVFAHIDGMHSDMDRFFEAEMGLTADKLSRLREMYLI